MGVKSAGMVSAHRGEEIKRQDVLFALHGDWGDHTRDRLVLALGRRLAERNPENRLLALEIPVCLVTSPLAHRDRFRSWARGQGSLRRVSDNVYLFRPWVPLTPVLAPTVPGISALDRWALHHQLQRAFSQIGFAGTPSMVWVSDPYHRDMARLYPKAIVVFNMIDDYLEFPANQRSRWRRARIRADQTSLLRRADFVFATARKLADRAAQTNPQVWYLPNGVDYNLFVRAADPKVAAASPLRDLPRPLFGFIGKVNEKIDFRLLHLLGQTYPYGSIVLVGGRDAGPGVLERNSSYTSFAAMPNVRFWGEVPYEELPGILAGFDVCLIPYIRGPLTDSVNPRKLHEYLASGKPVVATAIPEMAMRQEIALIAKNPEEFLAKIALALEQKGDVEAQRLRQRGAAASSWDNGAEEMLTIVDNFIKDREVVP